MAAHEPLRLLLDADVSGHGLLRALADRGHDVANAFAEMIPRFDRWLERFPFRREWLDRAVCL